MTTPTTNNPLVDKLGMIKAQMSDLSHQADLIKATLIEGGDNQSYEGQLFRATVSKTGRTFIDADLARKFLTEKQLAKITKTCSTYTVRVSARKIVV